MKIDPEKRCDNCEHLISIPKGNSYGDDEHLCLYNNYYMHGVHQPYDKYKHCSPAGKELKCDFKKRSE